MTLLHTKNCPSKIHTHIEPGHRWNWLDHFMHGNGRLGAIAAGWAFADRLRLNESSIWSRSTTEQDNPQAVGSLPKVRALLKEGKSKEAEFLCATHMMGAPGKVEPYQTMGDLFLQLCPSMLIGNVKNYSRTLNLQSGYSEVTYDRNGVHHKRQCFVSGPDQVVVWRHESDKKGAVGLHVRFHRITNALTKTDGLDTLIIEGQAGSIGTKFSTRVKVEAENGRIICSKDSISVEDADAVTLRIAIETDYWEDFRKQDCRLKFQERVQEVIEKASQKTYAELFEAHKTDFESLFNRSDLVLGENRSDLEDGEVDNVVLNRQFNYSKYFTISSSRKGGLPSNLQGLWCDALTPEWNSDYHTNINIQMNYWISEVAGLGDCHRPFLDWIEFIAKDGGIKAAKNTYNCEGWVMHHVGDPWGYAYPGDEACAGMWPTGAAWCCAHLFEHYLYNGDKQWLEENAYPVMKEAIRFFMDFCYEGEEGFLEVSPSLSPENAYFTERGEEATLCISPTMDHQMIRYLLDALIMSSEILDIDREFRMKCETMRSKLRPTRIGQNGTLMEWKDEVKEVEPGHRHIAHLYGLHPGNEINRIDTPELIEASKKSLERRLAHEREWGDAGFTFAWMALMQARMGDAKLAYENLNRLSLTCTAPNYFGTAHGIPTIDCAFGFGAAMVEMLVQSHEFKDGKRLIRILPACPENWASGTCKGIRCRGGHAVCMSWENGVVQKLEIVLGHEESFLIEVGNQVRLIEGKTGECVSLSETDEDLQS